MAATVVHARLETLLEQLQLLTRVPPPDIQTLHMQLCGLMIASGLASLTALLLLTAPYGRYSRQGWGAAINSRVAWLTQEVPSFILVGALLLAAGPESLLAHPTSLRSALSALFLAHYMYRSFIYPLTVRASKGIPLSVWLISLIFCTWNGFVQGYFLAYQLDPAQPVTPLAAAGLALQAFGWVNVMLSDNMLINLRKPGDTGYKIPYGGMFNFVSAGNYTSEMMEWSGYALAAGGALPAVAFAIFTACNLAPRGMQHHQWYLEKFKGEYPRGRKAIVPFLL